MSLSEARYHDLVDAAQEEVEDVFDDSALDVDLENSGGVLTVRFANGSQANDGMLLYAGYELDPSSYKAFRSAEYC